MRGIIGPLSLTGWGFFYVTMGEGRRGNSISVSLPSKFRFPATETLVRRDRFECEIITNQTADRALRGRPDLINSGIRCSHGFDTVLELGTGQVSRLIALSGA